MYPQMLSWIQFLLITPISFHKTIHLGAMCIYNYITVPPHTENWQIATNIHRICISSLLSLIQWLTLIPSIGICLYTQPQMQGWWTHIQSACLWCWRMSTWVVELGMVPLLVPEVFLPVGVSMQAHMFFGGTWHHPYICTCFCEKHFYFCY